MNQPFDDLVASFIKVYIEIEMEMEMEDFFYPLTFWHARTNILAYLPRVSCMLHLTFRLY